MTFYQDDLSFWRCIARCHHLEVFHYLFMFHVSMHFFYPIIQFRTSEYYSFILVLSARNKLSVFFPCIIKRGACAMLHQAWTGNQLARITVTQKTSGVSGFSVIALMTHPAASGILFPQWHMFYSPERLSRGFSSFLLGKEQVRAIISD